MSATLTIRFLDGAGFEVVAEVPEGQDPAVFAARSMGASYLIGTDPMYLAQILKIDQKDIAAAGLVLAGKRSNPGPPE